MEAVIWKTVYRIVQDVRATRPPRGKRFGDWLIVLTLLWAAMNHRPVSWAVQRGAWPVWCLRWIPRLPSSSTMSRRLRSRTVQEFLKAVLEAASPSAALAGGGHRREAAGDRGRFEGPPGRVRTGGGRQGQGLQAARVGAPWRPA